MGWGRQGPLQCELNLLGRPCEAAWVDKDLLVDSELTPNGFALAPSKCWVLVLALR